MGVSMNSFKLASVSIREKYIVKETDMTGSGFRIRPGNNGV